MRKMKKMDGTKVKMYGKLVDNFRLVDKPGFARTKKEIDPEAKWITGDYPVKKMPKTVTQYVSMLSNKHDEDLGIY